MAQVLYFLPNLRKAAADSVALRRSVLKERGLSEVFADVPFDAQPLFELPGRGPADKSGCILYYQTPSGAVPRRLGYFEQEQQWTPVGDGSQVWIGVDTAEPPKPEEMQRAKLCRGYEVPLGDGGQWTIPVIRRHDPEKPTLLPCAFSMNGNGQQVETVRAAYKPHWEAFEDVANWIYGGMEPGKFKSKDAVDLAVRAMSINYRFGWQEQNVLQLIDTENFLLVLSCAVDYPGFNEAFGAQKKMSDQSDTPSITSGATGDCPTTDQVGATCT